VDWVRFMIGLAASKKMSGKAAGKAAKGAAKGAKSAGTGAVKGIARLLVNSGKAAPSPAIGQSLGPLGVNMMEFCKEFNARTANLGGDVPVPVVLTAFDNRTFSFITKSPPTSFLLKV
jgi:ribosomal protein L11